MPLRTTLRRTFVALALSLTSPALAQQDKPLCIYSQMDACDADIDHAATDEDRSNAYYQRAKILGSPQMKMYDQAIDDLTKVILLNQAMGKPASTISTFYYDRATMKMNKGDTQGAVDDYGNAIGDSANNPGYAKYFVARAQAYETLGRPNDALKDYTTAITLSGDVQDWRTVNARAKIYADMKDYAKAAADYGIALKAISQYDVSNVTLIHNARGFAYLALNKLDPAYADFDAAVKIVSYGNNYVDPELASLSYNNRGKTLYLQELAEKDLGKKLTLIDKALADLNKAISLSPEPVARMFSNRGHIYLEQAKMMPPLRIPGPTLTLAENDFDQVLKLHPDLALQTDAQEMIDSLPGHAPPASAPALPFPSAQPR